MPAAPQWTPDSAARILSRAYADSGKTRDNYLHRLERLEAVVREHQQQQQQRKSGKQKTATMTTIYDILADPEGSYVALRDAYPNVNTRKNMLTLVLTLLRLSPELAAALPPGAEARWRKFHADMSGFQAARAAKNEPSARQMAAYVSLDEIAARYREVRRSQMQAPSSSSLAASQELVLLSLAASVPPKRCDYTSMRVVDSEADVTATDNFLVLPKVVNKKATTTREKKNKQQQQQQQQAYFVFNKYKTSATYGRVDQPLPLALEQDVRTSLRRHPRAYLFVNRFGEPFGSNNGFGKWMTRVFEKHLGRHLGASMLRHIYISDRVDLNESGEALSDVAALMMHSRGVQQQYKWSSAGLCKALQKAADGACSSLQASE